MNKEQLVEKVAMLTRNKKSHVENILDCFFSCNKTTYKKGRRR